MPITVSGIGYSNFFQATKNVKPEDVEAEIAKMKKVKEVLKVDAYDAETHETLRSECWDGTCWRRDK